MPNTIFQYVKQEEAAFALPITVEDGWEWSFKKHVRLSTLYKNSQFAEGNSDAERDNKPFNNIIRPILDLAYRTEGCDVKDVTLYVDDSDEYYKSFLVKKRHDSWAIENEIDTFIDDLVESYTDYGGALLHDVGEKKPRVRSLSSIAFCDQTNMLGGPLAFKQFYSPDELQSYSKVGWGDEANGADCTIQEAITLAGSGQVPDAQDGKENKTPGKYIECYEIHGVLPENYLKDDGDPDKFVRQMQILMFYTDSKGDKHGMKLYAGREQDGLFKQVIRNKIYRRALGMGGVEELFDPQVWANYSEIVMKGMLDAASKVIMKTTDGAVRNRHPNGLRGMKNLEIVELEEGKSFDQLNTTPVNLPLFERSVSKWETTAQKIGSASDASLGDTPPSGTPFKSLALLTASGDSAHKYRGGKIKIALHGVYTDWILPHIHKDLTKGQKFLDELSMDELTQVVDSVVINMSNDIKKEKILNGEEIIPQEMEAVEQGIREQLMRRGSKHFFEIFKDEMKDVPMKVKITIGGKQKDLDKITDKLVNVFRQILAAPQLLDDPRMAKLFNQIIEASGLSPIDFGTAVPSRTPRAAMAPSNPVIEQRKVVPNEGVAIA